MTENDVWMYYEEQDKPIIPEQLDRASAVRMYRATEKMMTEALKQGKYAYVATLRRELKRLRGAYNL